MTSPTRIFVVGCPRSGTTLLQSLLATHRSLRSFTESHLFDKGTVRALRSWRLRREVAAARAQGFIEENGLGVLTDQCAALAMAIQHGSARAVVGAFVALLDAAASASGRSGWIEKTPDHVFRIPLLAQAVPGAQFVHIVRDGTATVHSLRAASKRWGVQRSYLRASLHWRLAISATNRYRGAPGHHVVRYEDLTSDAEGTLQPLFRRLGLPWSAELLASHADVARQVISRGKAGRCGPWSPWEARALRLPPCRFSPASWSGRGEASVGDGGPMTVPASQAGPIRWRVSSVLAWVLGFAVVSEIAVFTVTRSAGVRAVVVGSAVSAGVLITALARLFGRRSRRSRLDLGVALPLVFLTTLGIFGASLGLAGGNSVVYLLADSFHWFVELVAMAVVGYVAFGEQDDHAVARFIAFSAGAVGLLSLLVVLLVFLGLETEAAHRVAGTVLVRLDVSRGFPQVPFLLVLGALTAKREWPTSTRAALWIAALLMSFAMLASLKRTLWLTSLAGIAILRLPRRAMAAAAVFGLMVVSAVAVFIRTFPAVSASILQRIAGALTYNEGYTIEDTIAERALQYAGLFPYVARNPLGYGFGAEFRTFAPVHHGETVVHYIHSLYLSAALQLGIPGLMALLLGFGTICYVLWAQIGRGSDRDWMLRAGLASFVALLMNGITLISIHSVFAGLAIGVGLAGRANRAGGLPPSA